MIVDIERLSMSERIQLVEDIWDTIATNPEALAIDQKQRDELDRRLQSLAQNSEKGVSWKSIHAKIENR